MQTITDYFEKNSYPGRGIMLGLTPNAKQAVLAYFIMGRSENSRNRVFVCKDAELKTEAHDPGKLSDPSLVIYTALRQWGKHIIITNGDQTDSIYEGFYQSKSFEDSLRGRCYEPDAPNFTPRISGLITMEADRLQYKLSILKKGNDTDCLRFFYEYAEPQPGQGYLIHTYAGDGNPLPAFCGEPPCLPTCNGIDDFTQELWVSLNADNRVALHVRYISVENANRMHSRTIDRFGGNEAASYAQIGLFDKTEAEK